MTGTYELAKLIQPGWQVLTDDEWLEVGMTVETETPDGGRRIWFVFNDRPDIACVANADDLVMSRPPDGGSTAADHGRSNHD